MTRRRQNYRTFALLVVSLTACALAGCQESYAPGPPTGQVRNPADGAAPVDDPGAKPDKGSRFSHKASSAPPVASKTLDLSYDDLKFEMQTEVPFQRSLLTEQINGYAGRKIRIRGFMLPSFVKDGITQFVLVRDNMECCFGPGAALYDCIMIQLVSGKSTSYSVRPITVEGLFSIKEWHDFDGAIRAIYHLDVDLVEN